MYFATGNMETNHNSEAVVNFELALKIEKKYESLITVSQKNLLS